MKFSNKSSGRASRRRYHSSSKRYAASNTLGDSSGEEKAWHPLESLEGWILFVSNLHEETSEDDVREAFSEHGSVHNVALNLDRRTGFVKGYALVEFATRPEAERARSSMDGADLLGVCINVDWCFARPASTTATTTITS